MHKHLRTCKYGYLQTQCLNGYKLLKDDFHRMMEDKVLTRNKNTAWYVCHFHNIACNFVCLYTLIKTKQNEVHHISWLTYCFKINKIFLVILVTQTNGTHNIATSSSMSITK